MVPGLLGLLGAAGTGAALAPALQVLTIPVGVLGAAFLLRAWWLQLSHGLRTAWQWRSMFVLAASTVTALTLWGLALRLRFRAANGRTDTLSIPFPRSHSEAIADVLPLLRAFGAQDALLPRRLYPESPSWPHLRVPNLRAAVEPGSPPPADGSVIAVSDRGRAIFGDGEVTIETERKGRATVPICEITSFSLLRSLTGCRFTLREGGNGHAAEHSISFHYPQAPAFLELTARLRHVLGNPC